MYPPPLSTHFGALEQAVSRSAPVATTTVRITVLSLWNFIAAPPLYKDRERLAWGSPPLLRDLGPLLKGLDDRKRKKILPEPQQLVDVVCNRSVRYGNSLKGEPWNRHENAGSKTGL